MFFARTGQLSPYIIKFPDDWGLGGITWYAMSYLVGALLALALSSYRAYKDGYPKDFFINLFFFAFPMGILGGRIWYVIASWHEFASGPWWKVFAIWEGGMAIQGGALLGIVSGMGFAKVRRKGTPLLQAADWAVPTVLVAQMIGRWGNFVNAEVFGNVVDISAYGGLPSFIIDQMGYGGSYTLVDSQMYVPLFLIEGLMNIGGYFILTHLLEDVLGKWHEHGDGLYGYFIWYGLTRIVLENVRFGAFNMHAADGQTISSAYVMAWVFFGVGLALFIGNQVCCKLYRKGILKLPDGLVHFFVNGAKGDPKNPKLGEIEGEQYAK